MLFDVQAALSAILADTPATPATIATNTPETPPLSQVSRVSQGEAAQPKIVQKPSPSTRAAILHALRSGLKTPGSIATTAKLGATLTYQELDRMAQEGLITLHRNGALVLNDPASNGDPCLDL